MKKISNIFSKIKNTNDALFLNIEKITIINRNKLFIQNYKEIIEISDALIKLTKITIIGKQLKIVSISKFFVEITGQILDIRLGDVSNGQ